MLALVGGVAGLLLAVWGVEGLLALGPNLPRAGEVGLRWPVVAVTLGIATLTGLLFGLAPALHATRVDLHAALGDSLRVTSAKGARARRALVVVQVGLALVLLAGAGLMIRSLAEVVNKDLGFRPDDVLTAALTLPLPAYQELAKTG